MQRAAQRWKPSHPLQRMMMTRRRPMMNARAYASASAASTGGAGGGFRSGGGYPNFDQGALGSWRILATSSLLIAGGVAADARCEPVTVTEKELEEEWDRFMISSMNPEEDDDDDDDDDDEEEDEEEEEEEQGEEVEEQGEEEEEEKEESIKEEEKEEEENNDKTSSTTQESNNLEPKSSSDDKTDETEDPYETLPEQDEETTCTMCLINRQGPCRPVWRKFEACMKDQLDRKHAAEQKQQQEQSEGINDTNAIDDNTEQEAATLGEECDKYYMPWISCMQNHWQRYILISNDFYQKEIVDPIEKAVHDNDKLLFAGDVENDVDPNSFLDLKDWFQFRQSLSVAASKDTAKSVGEQADDAGGEVGDSNTSESLSSPSSSDGDVTLIMAAATINLDDAATGREVAAAYIRDQDGTLLGFDQFSSLKKKRREILLERQQRIQSADTVEVTADDGKVTKDNTDKEKEEISVKEEKEEEKEATIPTVARCTFYLNPETTKSIQVFALYQDVSPDNTLDEITNTTETKQEKEGGATENFDSDSTSTSKSKPSETLYYSSLISLEDIQPPSSAN